MIFELCPYGIWNEIFHLIAQVWTNLNFVPMGFETEGLLHKGTRDLADLNFVPMGFETQTLQDE